jgi:hypothetical protein
MININFYSDEFNGESYTINIFSTLNGNRTVSNAGDVNNDGYDDVIIGEFYNANSNRAYIYLGEEDMNNEPDVILEGEYPDDHFGWSVSSAGDINNDGFSDVIIGAFTNDQGGNDAGSAYIYYGGNPMNNVPDIIFIGENGSDYFGCSVSSAGDVNNDGYDDVIIGAYGEGPFLDDRGKAYVFFGGNPMDNISDVMFIGSKDDKFGFSVSSAGDVNKDGYFDVIVGEPSFDDSDPGWAYVYFGGNPMNNMSDIDLIGGAPGDRFGWSVSDVGDINNDTFSDFIIGAPKNDSIGSDCGAAYIFTGNDSVDNVSDIILYGDDFDSAFGFSVSGGNDINNDGFDEIIIGAYENRTNGNSIGAVYIYYGNESLTNLREFIIEGFKSFDSFGICVSTAGDINKDGYYEIIVASKKYSYIFGPNLAPAISIIEPDGIADLTDTFYTIKWIDDDPDDNATINLYYCVELSDNPIPIPGASDLREDDVNDTFIWDTINVNSGTYFIKAKIDDGVNPEVWAFSSGKVTINHSPIITITAPNLNNNIADESFEITWTDHDDEENAIISVYYDTDDLGNDGTLITSNIEEDNSLDSFFWNTTNIPDGHYYIYAEIDDGINPIYTNYSIVPLTIHHKMPNLRIHHIGTTPTEPKIGEKVIFNMTLINNGDKVAQNCVVELIINDVLVGEVEIDEVLPDNGTYNAIFEPFTINSRLRSTLFRVKMNGEVIETKELTVVNGKNEELGLIFVLIPILLVGLIIVLFSIYMIKRRKMERIKHKPLYDPEGISITCLRCDIPFNIPNDDKLLVIQCPNCGAKGKRI